jgi:CRISPR-associated endoribonuclease Cas6
MFLHMVGRLDGELATSLHAPGGPKPFTLSLIQGPIRRKDNVVELSRDMSYWFRATSLINQLTGLLCAMRPTDLGEVRLGTIRCHIESIVTDPLLHPRARPVSYEALWEARISSPDPPPCRVGLRFLSPTTFRSGGRNVARPEGRLIFQSLVGKWNAFGPVHLGEAASLLGCLLRPTQRSIRTRVVPYGKYLQIGFVGSCEFIVQARDHTVWSRVPSLLADFAIFAGVGYKTTMGLGQTRLSVDAVVPPAIVGRPGV